MNMDGEYVVEDDPWGSWTRSEKSKKSKKTTKKDAVPSPPLPVPTSPSKQGPADPGPSPPSAPAALPESLSAGNAEDDIWNISTTSKKKRKKHSVKTEKVVSELLKADREREKQLDSVIRNSPSGYLAERRAVSIIFVVFGLILLDQCNLGAIASLIMATMCICIDSSWLSKLNRPMGKLRMAYIKFCKVDTVFVHGRWKTILHLWLKILYATRKWLEPRWKRMKAGVKQYLDECEKREIEQTTSLYEYEKLTEKSRQIRLLRIRRRLFFGGIKHDLIHVPLDLAPAFEAISYTWANPAKTHAIAIGGARFSIAVNVYNILQELRPLWRTRFIWIDSICINQNDNEEKSMQVGLIRDIFHSASRVIACLGDSADAHLVQAVLDEIVEIMQVSDTSKLSTKLLEAYILERTSNKWQALLNLFRHPYFSRTWVVQELAVARKIDVRYGGMNISWSLLQKIIDAIDRNDVATGLLLMSTDSLTSVSMAPGGLSRAGLIEFFRNELNRDGSISFPWLLEACLSFKATDPRDKVFALLGLSPSVCSQAISVNYTKAVRDVYIETAYHLINQGDFFEVIQWGGIGYPRATHNLPTWVPDWNSGRLTPILGQAYFLPGANYRASLDTRASLRTFADSETLAMQGVLVDHIFRLGSVFDDPTNHKDHWELFGMHTSTRSWLKQSLSLATEFAERCCSPNELLLEAFWRTIIGDRVGKTRPAPALYGKYYEIFSNMLQVSQLLLPELLQGRIPALLLPDHLAAQFFSLQMLAGEFCRAVSACSYRRRFCVTQKGYMAWVPPGSRPGDEIGIFSGGQTPFVLRCNQSCCILVDGKARDFYNLIGECYVHGMMDGEMFVGDVDTEEILLR